MMDTTALLRGGVGLRPRPDPAFLADAMHGLGRSPKTLPAKYFYDLEGSRLFEEITRLPEYYPTRAEIGILRAGGEVIGAAIPAGAAVVEFGAGSTEKIRVLLPSLSDAAAYVPVDVSGEYLEGEAARLRADMPDLEVFPVAGDFTRPIRLPDAIAGRPIVAFFPGSTIGNFEPDVAGSLLADFAERLGSGASLIIGVDLVKSAEILEPAYDDAAGVTGRFNLNLLVRLNRELGTDFDPGGFAHSAFFDRERSRIEMHLVSLRPQTVRLDGSTIRFEAGETIHTENSYKYEPAGFEALAVGAGWERVVFLTDPDRLFGVFVLRAV